MSYNLLCLLLGATIGYATAYMPGQLVGAQDAEPNEFPYVVSLQIEKEHFCGGCIISEYHILTAAHCIEAVQHYPLSDLAVVTGTNNVKKGGQSHKVAATYIHPSYATVGRRGWYNDVGIIKLKEPIHFNKVQEKIDLPKSPTPTNIHAVVSAWGYDSFPPRKGVSEVLQKLSLKIIPFSECKEYHGRDVYPNMICTLNERNIGTCSGDSGSPLVYYHKVIGVVSGGIPCALGMPDIFTDIFAMLSFIRKTMEK